jgi:glutamyl-tRNA(Gln) amidotransferase subunit D
VNKPVVLTYSQRSIDRASSDANLNLICSMEVAGLSDIAEVVLVGHANSSDDFCYAFPGTKVKKMHTSRRDAFKVINDLPIAEVYPNKIKFLKNYNRRKKGKIKVDFKFEDKVALVKIYPGQDPNILDFYLQKGYKGIVLELSGLGHAPTKRSRNGWTNKLKEVISKGIVVCACAQTVYGRLDPLVYSNGRELMETGIIYLRDMLSETALVKLGFVLGHKDWNVKEKMLENISGEFNNRLIYD